MADNTCHFGLNLFFADNGLEVHGKTPLYLPAPAARAIWTVFKAGETVDPVCRVYTGHWI